jgi:EAL domain-containing protein (putative c-di-GMP-specific phosphodiesterase class I)
MADRVAQAALDRAIEDSDQLLLVYQPIHDATSGAIFAAEALLRQRRESGEIREASIIAEAAEEGPELFVLDSLLVRKAYTDAAQWHEGGFPDIRLNVNLSPREFQEGNVLDRLTNLVTSCGIDTHRINLEITETSYIEKPEETMEVLAELKKLGVELWLDDFGTGHSSLEHLQHFPLAGLKIPGTFVRDMLVDTRCEAITRALIALAHELNLRVIAEEVETREQLAVLRDLGCDAIQGFLFSRPMELEDFLACLRGSTYPAATPGP